MYYVGIDLGGTKIAAGIVDENGVLLHKDNVPTKRERSYQEIIKDMAQLALKVISDKGLEIKDIKSIGIGSPGTPDSKKGILVYSCNLNFDNTPIRDELQKYINLPIYLENDANCAALAESVAGAAKDVDDCIAITLGTGIGGGIVINKKIYSGFNYAGSEIGHMVIVSDGVQCTCGRKGCWEAYASATALIRQTRDAAVANPDSKIYEIINGDLDKIDAKTSFDAAKMGDAVGQKVVDQYIKYIAEGLSNTINSFMPEVVVIGGGVCKEGEYLLKPLRERVYADIYCRGSVPKPQIRVAEMGNDAGIVGAAMLGK